MRRYLLVLVSVVCVSLGVLSLSFASDEPGVVTLDHIILTLKLNGVSDADIANLKDSLSGLFADEETAKEAGNAVFAAIDQAMADGLEGDALAAKITEVVAETKQGSLIFKESGE